MSKKWDNACGTLGVLVTLSTFFISQHWIVRYIFFGLLTVLGFVFSRWMKLCADELEPDIGIHDAVNKRFEMYSLLNEMGTLFGVLMAICTGLWILQRSNPVLRFWWN